MQQNNLRIIRGVEMLYDVIIYLGDYVEKETKLTAILTKLKLRYRFVETSMLYHQVGFLFGLCEEKESDHVDTPSSFPIDLMIFNKVDDETINSINGLLKEQQIEMKRKAMLTEHNVHWTLHSLLAEINEEHQYFEALESIQAILMSSKELVIEHYTKTSWKVYESAFYDAYEVLQNPSSPKLVHQCLEKLQKAKQQLTIEET